MRKLSQNELHELTGLTRLTVRKRLAGMPYKDGTHKAKLYDSAAALERLYRGDNSDGECTSNLAESRRLTIAKRVSIELDTEIKMRRLIPVDLAVEVVANFLVPVRQRILASTIPEAERTEILEYIVALREMDWRNGEK